MNPILIAILLLVLLIFVQTVQEPLENEIVPIAFPGQGNIQIPSNVQPQNGPLQVLGPVKLGVQGNQSIDFSTGQAGGQAKATIAFMNNGQQAVLETTGGTGQTDGTLRIQARQIGIQGPVSTGKLDAPKANFGALKVNRADGDRYVNGWGQGIHTWDLYANGTVAAGNNGDIAAYMNRDGNIYSRQNAYLNNIYANQVIVANRNVLGELNQLRGEVEGIRNRVNNYTFMF